MSKTEISYWRKWRLVICLHRAHTGVMSYNGNTAWREVQKNPTAFSRVSSELLILVCTYSEVTNTSWHELCTFWCLLVIFIFGTQHPLAFNAKKMSSLKLPGYMVTKALYRFWHFASSFRSFTILKNQIAFPRDN